MALVDDVTIKIKAGRGGDGARSFIQKHPDGGDGGLGGNIYFKASHNTSDLSQFRFQKEIKAQNGQPGGKKNMNGENGKDEIVLVPLGTKITDTDTLESFEFSENDQTFCLARGGRKGTGNHNYQRTDAWDITNDFTKGSPGEEKNLHLVLSLIADIGLVGFPNAGKSSLLDKLTNAKPKIGNYPFTTLNPNLGVMDGIVLADIPGLIEGASKGTGLGIEFLKHIEKTKVLFHCIDASQSDAIAAYSTVRHEFDEYSKELGQKKEIILLTKIDLVEDDQLQKQLKSLKTTKKEIIPVSIYDEKTIEQVRKIMLSSLSVES